MSNNIGPSIYIPSDKNIFDALQHKKVTHSEILSFLRNRGLIVSQDLAKDELCKMVSQLTFDHHDYCFLTKLIENPNRKERITRTSVKTKSCGDELISACQSVATDSKGGGDSYKVTNMGDSAVLIVTYTDVDFSKTELRQRTIKKCVVELHAEGDEVTVRMPATKKGREVAERIKRSLSAIKGEQLEEEVISLENITQPEARSYFFGELIKSVPGYKFIDVYSVDVHHDVDTLSDDEDDDTKPVAGYIRKAALAGDNVLQSAEFNQLNARGFFISKIVWVVEDISIGGDRVELEAQFGEPSTCTDFKYLVRGVYSFNERTGLHNVTRRVTSKIETNIYNSLVEGAVKIAFEKVMEKYTEKDHEEN